MVLSTHPDVEIPTLSVYDYLFGDLGPDDLTRPAIIDGVSGAETTYGELVEQINGFAGGLVSRGLTAGDVVGLLCPNAPVFPVAFHGILRAGATATTINSLYTDEEIALQLTDAGASFLVTVSALLPAALAAATRVGIDHNHLIVLDGSPNHPSLADLLGDNTPPPVVDFDPATQVAVLPYSSGTTGRPKGVMLSHRNLVANVAQCSATIGLERDDRVLAVLPFFHIYGLTVLLNYALKRRSTLITMPRFDLAEFLRITSGQRCSWVFIAPPIAVALAKHPLVENYDFEALKVVFSGAAPLSGDLAGAVAKRLDCVIRQGYGMTELSPVSHVLPLDRHDIPLTSVGLALPNLECRLVDIDTGADIEVPAEGPSAPGELLCRGPNVMLGYLGNPEATAETLDDNGWLRTGDIATVDAAGIYTIVDRLKELIKYKGYQVAPAVLEAVLLRHPLIADSAVIGVTDEDGQEIPKAYVVLQPDALLSTDDVMSYVQPLVARHERIRRVEFIDAIPKSTAGKILRKELRARERQTDPSQA
ncbi:MAG: AMP-dependent synthetase [Glaciihabitans sp.]|nr:AMP-dependent synthetase [Glaciihabitans sp.]